MTRNERQTLKAKIRLYCVLSGWKMGHRGGLNNGPFVYEEACRLCKKTNKGCRAYHQPVLLLNVKNMRMSMLDINNHDANERANANKMVWCVNWIYHV